jgi:hypothetical protein
MLDYSTPGNFTFSMGDLVLSVGTVTDPTKSGLNMTEDGLEIKVVMEPMEALEVCMCVHVCMCVCECICV